MPTYGTTAIPGTSVTTQSSDTVSISVAFNAAVGLVGGYDAANGTATEGDVYSVDSLSDARDLFGTDSELYNQVQLAYSNGAAEVYAVPLTEAEDTESFSGTSSGTLGNVPVFDPNVNTEHDVTAQDTSAGSSVDVTIVYDESPSTPSESGTINLNPVNGAWSADSSSDYDITYEYGDFTTAITDSGILDEDVRFVVPLTENQGVASTLESELTNAAQDFNFKRGVVGGMPGTTATDYSDNFDSQRLVVVMSSRGTSTDSDEVRVLGAVGGNLAGNALGDSATYESLAGLDSLNQDLKPSEAGDFIDKQVLPLIAFDEITVAKGITTSTDNEFGRIHTCEIVDEVTEIAHQIGQNYVGDPNLVENRDDLRDSLVSAFQGMANESPPLLAAVDGSRPYSVAVTVGDTDTEVDVNIGVDPVDMMESVDVTLGIGDVILNQTQV